MRNPAILAGLMVNEWLRSSKNPTREPFPEQAVIEWPLYRRMGPVPGRVGIIGSKNRKYWRMTLDRRSFVMSIFGGMAAASLGGIALSQAAEPQGPAQLPVKPGDIDPATKAGLDKADADFNQVVVRERVIRRRGPYGRPVVRERVIVRRRPRPYYRRRGPVVRRRVIIR